MERQDFMSFFRDDEKLNTLSTDDRIEIFSGILSGSSDITIELLQELLQDYCVDNIVVYDRKQLFDRFPILNTEPITATTTTTQTEEETPQQLEIGKWYTFKESNCDWLMNYQGEGDVCYGFNTYGLWDNDYIMSLASSTLNWKPATFEEIQTALIKEARKRGYTANNFKTLKEGTSGFDTDFNFTYFDDILFCKPLGGGAVVYENGVWAEVIEEVEEEQTQPDKLIPNRWYTLKENADSILIFVKDSEDASNNYGFLRDGSWFENFDGVWDYTTRPQKWREATQEEVQEAMINHFKKIYHGNYSECLHNYTNYKGQEEYELDWDKIGQCLRYTLKEGGVGCVYDRGRWADLITTNTDNGEVFYDTDTQKNTKLTKGKWYKNLTHEGSYFLFDGIGNSNYRGCGVDYMGNWHDSINWGWGLDDFYREATQQEVEEILIKEARNRGYKGGQLIKSFIYGKSRLREEGEGFRFDKYYNRLWYNDNIIFQGGVWAEVIEYK